MQDLTLTKEELNDLEPMIKAFGAVANLIEVAGEIKNEPFEITEGDLINFKSKREANAFLIGVGLISTLQTNEGSQNSREKAELTLILFQNLINAFNFQDSVKKGKREK